jgi:phosphonoacetate hydrolase
MDAALYSMRHDTSIGLFYIHTTDYPMHTWAPESKESREHLHKIDQYVARIAEAMPTAIILITADHSVHHKSVCWDIQKVLAKQNIDIEIALSPERDKYFKHHRGFGGTSYVYLKKGNNLHTVAKIIKELKGVDEVLTRKEAAKRFHLMPERIGDLMVLGDSTTVFGDLDTEMERLPDTYRSHGSIYETSVPIFIYNANNPPAPAYFNFNYQIAKWLYR